MYWRHAVGPVAGLRSPGVGHHVFHDHMLQERTVGDHRSVHSVGTGQVMM